MSLNYSLYIRVKFRAFGITFGVRTLEIALEIIGGEAINAGGIKPVVKEVDDLPPSCVEVFDRFGIRVFSKDKSKEQ